MLRLPEKGRGSLYAVSITVTYFPGDSSTMSFGWRRIIRRGIRRPRGEVSGRTTFRGSGQNDIAHNMRIVLDTDVLMSDLRSTMGASRILLLAIEAGVVTPLVSVPHRD